MSVTLTFTPEAMRASMEEHPRLGDGPLRVTGEFRACLETHIAVGASRGVPDRPEEIGSPPDVVEDEGQVDLVVCLSLGHEFPEGLVVIRASRDGLLEDGGV
jgi:hypothetical protein